MSLIPQPTADSVPLPLAGPVAALEYLAEAAGLRHSPEEVSAAWRDAATAADELRGGNEVMIRCAERIGLRLHPVSASAAEALRLVRNGAPVLALAVDGSGWIILESRRGGRIRVLFPGGHRRSRWLTAAELAQEVAADVRAGQPTWLLPEPALPCEALRGAEAHGHEEHDEPSPWRRLLALAASDRQDIWVVILFGVWIGVLTLATPIAVETLVNLVAFGGFLQPVLVLSLLLFGCVALAGLLRILQTWVVELIQRRLFVRIFADFAARLPRAAGHAYDRFHGPELINRFLDVVTVQKMSAQLLLDGVAIVLQTVIGLVILAFYHPVLLGFDLVLLIAILGIVFGLGRGAVRTSVAESFAKYGAAAWLEELARCPSTFKQSGGREYASERADVLARVYLESRSAHFRIILRQLISAIALQAVASTALLGLGGWLVIAGQLTLGQLVASELIVTVVLASFTKLGKHLEGFYDLLAAMNKLGHVVDLPLERNDGHALPPASGGAAVSLRDVSLRYAQGSYALRHVNLTIRAGECVALTGPSGGGKTTLIDVLFGLRAADDGVVAIDGVDVRELDLDDLRRSVAAVKTMEIIAGTVADNVRFGRLDVTPHRVREALDSVGLLHELSELPEGVRTELTDDGRPLSGGQAQRLCLARAVAGLPRMLIVDELIDRLEPGDRIALLESLRTRGEETTIIVVTHDPEVMQRCDRTLFLEQGVLRELETSRPEEPA